MANMFCVNKAERTKTRKLPLLPRFGVTVEIAGRQFTYKQVPFIETILNLRERGFSRKNLTKLASEELAEIRFPASDASLAIVKDLHPKTAKKAPAAKAAAKKKAERSEETPATT
jgi:hypothetical protein